MTDQYRKVKVVEATRWLLRRWLVIFIMIFGVLNILPFLAPVAMKLNLKPLGDVIYTMYAPLCHQMAQRSLFLFGDQLMYAPDQFPLELTADLTTDMFLLRQFNGNELLGWKVAWSDRMVYMYGTTWLAAAMFAVLTRYRHRHIKRISWWLLILLLLPMVVDGLTHMQSDFTGGIRGGYRYTNEWLIQLIGESLPRRFYEGDAFGSFNSWMRLISGIGFGLGIIWFTFPALEQEMHTNYRLIDEKVKLYYRRQSTG